MLKALFYEAISQPRVKLFSWMLAVELGVFLIATMVPLSPADTQSLGQTYAGTSSRIQTMSLFGMWFTIAGSNMAISLVDGIPGVGFLTFLPAVYNSGLLVEAAAITSLHTIGIVAGLTLLLFPHAILELAAYALAASAGFSLLWASIKRQLRSEVKVYLLQMGFVIALIDIAAMAESITILWPVEGALVWFLVAFGAVKLRRLVMALPDNTAH